MYPIGFERTATFDLKAPQALQHAVPGSFPQLWGPE
jgi:hypothetical protein